LSDIFRYTTEKLCNIVVQYTTSKETTKLLPTLGSREVTLGSSNETPSIVAIRDAKRGTNGSRKRRKQCSQFVTIMADYDDDNDKKVDGSSMGCIATTMDSGKHQAWPPIDHFERLLKEVYPNHTYPIKHKVKHSDMMKNFMTSGKGTRGRPRRK
jgi:hypothetical protein